MMVATMMLKIAATELVDAAATRFAYCIPGPATVTRLAAVALRFAARGVRRHRQYFIETCADLGVHARHLWREGIPGEICWAINQFGL
jgi:hypothetical protein